MGVLRDHIQGGFGIEEDLSCSETILQGANRVYNLGLDEGALKMAAGFSGGLHTESLCGALSAGAMVLSCLYVEERSHTSPRNKRLVAELMTTFQERMQGVMCGPLKAEYRHPERGCRGLIIKTAEILDEIIAREGLPGQS